MQRTIPWKNIDELLTVLQTERDALNRQIEALETSRDPNDQTARLEILLCQYLLMGSAQKAVDWATGLGWRIDSINHGRPSTRNWQAKDLYNAIQSDKNGLPTPLVALCKQVFYANQDKANSVWS